MNTDKFPFKKVFAHEGESFSANKAATEWLKEKGFSLGTMESDRPRAIVHGHTYVPKWKHLDQDDKDSLDGVAMSDDFRDGDITVHLKFDPG